MMCQACTEGRCWDCGMQTWCECDCLGPDGDYYFYPDDQDSSLGDFEEPSWGLEDWDDDEDNDDQNPSA